MQGSPLHARDIRALPTNETLLPEYLKNLGYETRLVGKWHLGYRSKNHTPTQRGFDSFLGYYNGYVGYYNYTVPQLFDDGSVSIITHSCEYIITYLKKGIKMP